MTKDERKIERARKRALKALNQPKKARIPGFRHLNGLWDHHPTKPSRKELENSMPSHFKVVQGGLVNPR